VPLIPAPSILASRYRDDGALSITPTIMSNEKLSITEARFPAADVELLDDECARTIV
jgi:hypothetical protein